MQRHIIFASLFLMIANSTAQAKKEQSITFPGSVIEGRVPERNTEPLNRPSYDIERLNPATLPQNAPPRLEEPRKKKDLRDSGAEKSRQAEEIGRLFQFFLRLLELLGILIDPVAGAIVMLAIDAVDLSTSEKQRDKLDKWVALMDKHGLCKGCQLLQRRSYLRSMLVDLRKKIDKYNTNPGNLALPEIDQRLLSLYREIRYISVWNKCSKEVGFRLNYQSAWGDPVQAGPYSVPANGRTYLQRPSAGGRIQTMSDKMSLTFSNSAVPVVLINSGFGQSHHEFRLCD